MSHVNFILGVALFFSLLFIYFKSRKYNEYKYKLDLIRMSIHEIKNIGAVITENSKEMANKHMAIQDIQELHRNVATLTNYISEFVSVFVKGSNYDIEPNNSVMNFRSAIMDTAKLFGKMAFKKNVDLSVLSAPDGLFISDPKYVKQVLINVIGNAVKYTDRGYVEISGTYDNNIYKIVVEDTGIGIPSKEINNIHKKFYRATTSVKEKGDGLGLAVCASILSAMYGKIEINSTVGIGTKVVLKFPTESVQ